MKKVISILVLSISFMCGLFINGEVKATEKDEEKVYEKDFIYVYGDVLLYRL